MCENQRMAPKKKIHAPLGLTFITQWRETCDLTQEDLAGEIDLSRSGLSKIETADAPYTQRTLEAIARTLKCEPWELLAINPSIKENGWEESFKASVHRALERGADPTDIRRVIETEAPIRALTAQEKLALETQKRITSLDQGFVASAGGHIEKLNERRGKAETSGTEDKSDKH